MSYPSHEWWCPCVGCVHYERPRQWQVVVLSAVFACLFALFGVTADAQDGMTSRPQGSYGEGHDLYHEFYLGLYNGYGGSCCNGGDCRPTQARWNNATQTWDVMIDGKWQTMSPNDGYKVLNGDKLLAQGRERWDAQAHICAGRRSKSIYCFIPPASGG